MVEQYLNDRAWIGDSDPVAYGLLQAAKELDSKWATSLWAEFNKTIRYIESLNPAINDEPEVDPLLMPLGLETRGASFN